MKESLRDFKLNLTANVEQQLNVNGNFIGILESSTNIYISIDGGPFVKRKAGHFQRTDYDTLRVKSLVDNVALVVAGYGDFYSAANEISVNTSAELLPGNTNTGLADVTIPAGASAIVAAGNVKRKWLAIKALNSNDAATFIRVGVAPDATHGIELGAGEAVQIETSGAISAYNTGAVDFVVSVLEVQKL